MERPREGDALLGNDQLRGRIVAATFGRMRPRLCHPLELRDEDLVQSSGCIRHDDEIALDTAMKIIAPTKP